MDENQTPCAEPEGSFNNPIIIHIPEWMPIRMWGDIPELAFANLPRTPHVNPFALPEPDGLGSKDKA